MLGEERDSDAYLEVLWRPVDTVRFFQGAQHSTPCYDRLRQSARYRQEERKLVPAEARRSVRGPQCAEQAFGHLLQGIIACCVAETIIDQLETVEIQE